MKLEYLAKLMDKTIDEVKEILEQNEVIELKLTERKNKQQKENSKIQTMN
jgi:hypothetical protein